MKRLEKFLRPYRRESILAPLFKLLEVVFDLMVPVVVAQIIDVRTPAEYNGGHIKGSKNVPLQSLNQNLGKINKNKPVITCCASGARSAAAKSILKNSGFTEVYNGGGWSSLKSKLS